MSSQPFRLQLLCVLGAAGSAGLAGCELFSSDSIVGDWDVYSDVTNDATIPDVSAFGPDGRPLIGHTYGEPCLPTDPCRSGLECDEATSTCVPVGTVEEGLPCTISEECADGLACGLTAQCEPSAGLPEGSQCGGPSDCEAGLRCNLYGFVGLCEPAGTADAGQTCTSNADCLAPLGCSPDLGTCQIPIFGGLAFMPDAECETVDETVPFGVYFEVPRDEPLADFFRLPFPNDIRARDGALDLGGFHNPGLAYIGGELVDLYLDALEDTFTGFSTNPTIYFRYTRTPDFGSIEGSSESPRLRFINIDPDSPNFGNGVSYYWTTTNGRGKFICPNYTAVRPSWQTPLDPGTTYAVILTDGIRSEDGDLPLTQPDLTAVLAETRPSDSALGAAWDAYEPLRAWIAQDETLDTVNIAGATVFTTMDPTALMAPLRAAVRRQPVPELEQLTECASGVISPCDDGTPERSCVSTTGNFTQIHGTYEAPVWQHGTRPYLTQNDGGALQVVDGSPIPAASERICFAMTIPNAAMPAGGWPTVIYSHGTGGSFTSAIREGVSGALADIALADERRANFVTITLDGVQHGQRRGQTDLDPEPLFYNFVNPQAAHGNIQQGAADLFALTNILQNTAISAAASPTGEEIRFDPSQLYFFGHSQGAQVGAPFVAFETGVRAAVFSGSGGSLTLSLLNKTEPVDIASAVSFILTDGGRNGGQANDRDVLLSLLQWHVDRVDPLNYARLFFRTQTADRPGQHALITYGYGDSYSPEPNQKAFAGASGAQLATPRPGDLTGLPETTYPVSGNRTVNDLPVTAAVVAVQPAEDYDGHFVVFRDSALNRQMREFLATALLDGVPTILAP